MKLFIEVGLDPDHTVLDGDLASPTERGTAAPTFRPMSTVAKRSPISATAELLFSVSRVWMADWLHDGLQCKRWLILVLTCDKSYI